MTRSKTLAQELWTMKLKIFRSALTESGVQLSFQEGYMRDDFRMYLYNFKALVTKKSHKYREEWRIVSQISIYKRGANELLLIRTNPLTDNEKYLVEIATHL